MPFWPVQVENVTYQAAKPTARQSPVAPSRTSAIRQWAIGVLPSVGNIRSANDSAVDSTLSTSFSYVASSRTISAIRPTSDATASRTRPACCCVLAHARHPARRQARDHAWPSSVAWRSSASQWTANRPPVSARRPGSRSSDRRVKPSTSARVSGHGGPSSAIVVVGPSTGLDDDEPATGRDQVARPRSLARRGPSGAAPAPCRSRPPGRSRPATPAAARRGRRSRTRTSGDARSRAIANGGGGDVEAVVA